MSLNYWNSHFTNSNYFKRELLFLYHYGPVSPFVDNAIGWMTLFDNKEFDFLIFLALNLRYL